MKISQMSISSFREWLLKGKYANKSIWMYTRPLKIISDKGIDLEYIEKLDWETSYLILFRKQAPSPSVARAYYQGIIKYREYLECGGL